MNRNDARLIQGGIGIGVASWTLAREVSMLGQLGVVSGTALDTVMIRRLAAGDPGGHMRREIAAFPFREYAKRTVDRYYRPSGSTVNETIQQEQTDPDDNTGETAPPPRRAADARDSPSCRNSAQRFPGIARLLLMLANFTDVYLAKEDHDGLVGINYLHKIQLPILPSLYGAMHAGWMPCSSAPESPRYPKNHHKFRRARGSSTHPRSGRCGR